MCLSSSQKELIHEKIIEFLSGGGIPELSQKCDGEPRAELLMETARKIFDEIVSKKPKIKALLKSKVDESFSLLDEWLSGANGVPLFQIDLVSWVNFY